MHYEKTEKKLSVAVVTTGVGRKMAGGADARLSPSFLKKITEMPMRTLSLPSSFVRRHGKLLGNKVILEGPSGRQWKVVVDGSLPSLNVAFGQGWEDFVAAHVLQLGDQLCFMLAADSHFLVEVYDESGCQKTSALDAAGSSALAPSEAALKWPSPLYSRKPSELKIPPLTSTRPAMRLSQIQNLDDKVENLAMYTNAEKALSDIQLEPATGSALSRRESALESIRRDSALRASVRDPYLSTKAEDHAGLSTNSYSTGWSAPMDLQENLAESLSDLTDCFVDMEKILAEPPDLTDTEPLVIENILPCWELHEHPPAVVATQLGSLAPLQIDKRVSTLFSQIPTVSATDSIKHFDTTATQPGSLAPRRVSTYFSRRPSELQIPLVSESDAQTPTPMRLSQIQNLDDPTLKIENLAMYTRTAAEKALSDLQLESPMGSFLSRRNSTL